MIDYHSGPVNSAWEKWVYTSRGLSPHVHGASPRIRTDALRNRLWKCKPTSPKHY